MGGGPAAKARSIAETGAIPWWADAFVDIGSAAASASLLAPFVTIVDKAVVEKDPLLQKIENKEERMQLRVLHEGICVATVSGNRVPVLHARVP